ncbi:uncharacterized protein V1513DRAFT_444635 [Lipomyces chichibuensis]|uniref:uncharacterized protein n=1 Tax=Lipomyces chichibuensis TaxID=1546026 RepID=UPI003343E962
MASETALLASRFAVSIAQARALVASWLGPDPTDIEDSKNHGSRTTAGSDRGLCAADQADTRQEKGDTRQEQGGKRENSREIRQEKAKQNGEQADVPGNDDVEPSSENEASANDEDEEFANKYTIIVGRGGIGTPAASNTTESSIGTSVSAFRQRKTIEFMQKQIQRRRAEDARAQVNSKSSNSEDVDYGDELESRTTAVYVPAKRPVPNEPAPSGTHSATEGDNDISIVPSSHAKRRKTLSILDDLIQSKQEQQQKKKKKKKKKKKSETDAEV